MSSRKSSSVIFRCRSLSSELLSKTILPVCLNPSRKGTRKFWIFFLLLSSQNLDAPPPRPFFSRPNSGRHTSIVVIYCPPRLLLQTLFWYYPLVMLHFFFVCQTRAYFSTIYFLAWREPRMCLFKGFAVKISRKKENHFYASKTIKAAVAVTREDFINCINHYRSKELWLNIRKQISRCTLWKLPKIPHLNFHFVKKNISSVFISKLWMLAPKINKIAPVECRF